MTTFCDALEYCDVHGHDAVELDISVMDMIGTKVKSERCVKCGRTKDTVVVDDSRKLRLSETFYPNGRWK